MREATPCIYRSLKTPVILLLLLPVPLLGQGGWVVHDVGFETSLSLPASWSADSQDDLAALRERSLGAMSGSALPALRELARDNSNVLLFRATDSGDPRKSVTLNVSLGPGSNVASIDLLTAEELLALRNELCRAFADQVADAGGQGSCTEHERRTLQGRGTLILRQAARIPSLNLDNRRVVVLIPADGLLFTLNVSVPANHHDAEFVDSLLASVRVP